MLSAQPLIAVVAGLALATGCSLFGGAGPAASTLPHITVTRPVVIVPGILGSRLEDERNGRVVWGKLFQLRALTVHETLIQPDFDGKDGLELPIASPDLSLNRDHLVATGILDRFAIIPRVAEVQAYQRLLEALEVCGYRPGEVASCGLSANASVFPYDWRRDIVENAQRLAAAVRGIQERAGGPETRVDLIAHSMGGLVVEYYLLYGDEDVLDRAPLPPPSWAGAANVGHLILLGVPHHGSVEALGILDRGRRVGWRSISNEATFTMPSLYQLLPPASAVHVHDPEGGAAVFDLDDPADWQSFGLSVFSAGSRKAFLRRCKVLFPTNWQRQSDELYTMFPAHLERVLARSARLRRALAAFPSGPLDGVQVHLIGSATRSTAAAAELRREGGGWRLAVGSGLGGEAPGDGTVTAASFTWGASNGVTPVDGDGNLPFAVEWVDEEHSKLPRNPEVLRRIAEILAG
jgi:pimeloyl-ACP methyl ester carboxylesterase